MLFPGLNPSKKLSKLSDDLNAIVSCEFDCHQTHYQWDSGTVFYFNKKFTKEKLPSIPAEQLFTQIISSSWPQNSFHFSELPLSPLTSCLLLFRALTHNQPLPVLFISYEELFNSCVVSP